MKHPLRAILSATLALCIPALLHAQAPAGGDPFVKGTPPSTPPPKVSQPTIPAGTLNFNNNGGTLTVSSNPTAPETRNCLFVMEVYSLDKNDAIGILDSERGSAARYRRVTDLAGAGKARLEILTALATKSGQRAVSESTDEVRYASDFVPPQTRNGAPLPNTWTARGAGDVVEFEPLILPDERTWDLNLAPSRVRLAGFREIGGMAGDAVVSQPQFDSQKITEGTLVADGEPHFAGSFTPASPAGMANGGAASRVWLAFVHLSLQKPVADPIKPQAKAADWSALNLDYTCYSLDRALARDVLVSSDSMNAPWEKLQALIAEKKARFEHVLTLNTKPGQRAVVEENQEMQYATTYFPEQWSGSAQDIRRTTTAGPAQEEKNEPPKKDAEKGATATETVETTHTEANPDRTPGSAEVFEMRPLGALVEAEPLVSADGLSVDISEAVRETTYLGDLKTPGAGARYAAQPIFETRKITTGQVIPTGRRILVGTFNPPVADGVSVPAEPDRVFLVFVRATSNAP